MSQSFEFDPVARITAGAIGVPGARTFFVQASGALDQVSLLAEKEQVRALAQGLLQLLGAISESEDEPPDESELELQAPLEPEWRAGDISIEYDQVTDRVVLLITEAQPEIDEEEDPEPLLLDEPATARFVASRAQARALASHAIEIVSAGRPRCQLCSMPIDEGTEHICPAMNGHRK